MKGGKELDEWRDSQCLWMGRIHIVKTSVLPDLIYIFNAMPIKIPASYFMDINNQQSDTKVYVER